jgi:DNA primase
MPTSHFDRAALPPARSFYQAELGELRRPDRKGWARPKSGCPFHASESKKSFFVNVDRGGFYCFGCDAKGGDVIEFVRLRYKLSFPDALRHLRIESKYQPKRKPKRQAMSLDRLLARKLAMAVEYGMEMPADGR